LRVWKKVKLHLVSRAESASPATGSHKQHDKEQHEIVDRVFAEKLTEN
jgi:2-oxoglutarate dehydrogenase complex dehydrogenase (E1) component-like enzyme